MGNKHCHESPDGFHEVCKRSMTLGSSDAWANFAPHLLACLLITGVFVTGLAVWRMRARRDREPADYEWQSGKGALSVPRMCVQHVIVRDSAVDKEGKGDKEGPYMDEKMAYEGFVKAGEWAVEKCADKRV